MHVADVGVGENVTEALGRLVRRSRRSRRARRARRARWTFELIISFNSDVLTTLGVHEAVNEASTLTNELVHDVNLAFALDSKVTDVGVGSEETFEWSFVADRHVADVGGSVGYGRDVGDVFEVDVSGRGESTDVGYAVEGRRTWRAARRGTGRTARGT